MRTLIAVAVLQYLENSGVCFSELPEKAISIIGVGLVLAVLQDCVWFFKD